jgi:hypothetical protein
VTFPDTASTDRDRTDADTLGDVASGHLDRRQDAGTGIADACRK